MQNTKAVANYKNLFQAMAQLAGREPLYLVGGFLRDMLMGKSSQDLDFAFLGNAEELAKRMTHKLGGSFVVLDKDQGIYRVVIQKDQHPVYLDVSACQGKTIEQDLSRRDFTANALAIPLNNGFRCDIIDLFHGQSDLKKRIVRQVSPRIYEEDPLRILRAFRFVAQWKGSLDQETSRTIQSHVAQIHRSSGERIREELLKLFSSRESHHAVRLMDKAGLLTELFPELEKARGLALDYYPKIGVLGHVLNTLERLEAILKDTPKRFPRIKKQLQIYFSEKVAGEYPRSAVMKLSALLHDIAKPATAQVIDGRTRFFQHDEVGQKMAESLLSQYRFSRKEEASVGRLVRAHMRPGNLAHAPILTDKAIFRFFRDLEEDAVAMLIVSLADHQTYLKSKDYYSSKDPHVRITKMMLERTFLQQEKVKPKKLIDGNFVMKELNLPPSPLVGEILSAIEEAQAEGKVSTQSQALAFAREYLRSKS